MTNRGRPNEALMMAVAEFDGTITSPVAEVFDTWWSEDSEYAVADFRLEDGTGVRYDIPAGDYMRIVAVLVTVAAHREEP